MSKIEIEEWSLDHLREALRRLQRQLRVVSGMNQAIYTLYAEAARRLDELQSILENLESLSTGWWRESRRTVGEMPSQFTSLGLTPSGKTPLKGISTDTVSVHPGAQPLNPIYPEAATAVPSKVKTEHHSGGAGRPNGKSKDSPQLVSHRRWSINRRLKQSTTMKKIWAKKRQGQRSTASRS